MLTKKASLSGISSVAKGFIVKHRGGGEGGDNDDNNPYTDKKLHKILSLHLQNKGFKTIMPDSFTSFTSLAHLYLYDNSIERMQGFSSLPFLESLHLSGNKITRMEDLQNLHNLRKLFLGYNSIELVEGLENLLMLAELHLECQHLPPEMPLLFSPNCFDNLHKLKLLNIKGNNLNRLDDLASLVELDTLILSKNELSDLKHVTNVLKQFQALRVVDLRENKITKNSKYKQSILGFCNRLELLDEKDINEVQRQTIQRLQSIKTQKEAKAKAKERQARSMGAQRLFPSENNVSRLNSSQEASREEVNALLASLLQTDDPEPFDYSTPISSSPMPGADRHALDQEEWGPQRGPQLASYDDGGTGDFSDRQDMYHSRSTIVLDEDYSRQGEMSEVAKIIFRLSNLSPSASAQTLRKSSSGQSIPSYWGSSTEYREQTYGFKESRPLSPLEVDVNPSTLSIPKVTGARRTTVRRSMSIKLPPRTTFGAGRALSPLEELPTPDSSSRVKTHVSAPCLLRGQGELPQVSGKKASFVKQQFMDRK